MSVVRACSPIPQHGDNKFQRTQFWRWLYRITPLNSLDLMNGCRCFSDPWDQKFEDPLLQRSSPWLQRTTYSPAGRRTGRWIKIGQDFVCLLGLGVDYTSGCQSKLSCGKSGVNYPCYLINCLAVDCSVGFWTTFQANHANLLQVQKSLEDATTHLAMQAMHNS